MSSSAGAGGGVSVIGQWWERACEHCHTDNPVFVWGMAWVAFLALTGAGTLYYKYLEASQAREAEQKKQAEEAAALQAKRRQAAEPRLI